VCGRLVAEDIAGIVETAASQTTDQEIPASAENKAIAAIRQTMNRDVGVVRDRTGLERAIARLSLLRLEATGAAAEDSVALALLIARAAERRKESRGAHFRSDGEPQIEPPAHSESRWDELTAAGHSPL
jgi:L-aspartate oxidase